MEATTDFLTLIATEARGLPVTLALFLVLLALLYWYSTYPYTVLARCGISHPKPLPFYGNMFQFRQGFWDFHKDLIKQHGRVCGYYLGRRPNIVIADPEMLRKIMVKDFSSFPNRTENRAATKPLSDCLLMLRDECWKRVRSILTPSFSSAKLKQMVPLINKATETLLTNLKTQADSGLSFDIHRNFGCFTMDVIASVGFGTQVDSQKNPKDPFVYHAQKFFSFTFFRPITMFFIAFPFLIAPLAQLLPNKSRDEMNSFFIGCIKAMIKQRDKLPATQRRCDFLQLMLDVRSEREYVSLDQFDLVNQFDLVSSADENTQATEREEAAEEASRRAQRRLMTEDEIVGQVFIFLLAGYETSSSTLAFVCYLLAIHPECQRRVQEEVDGFFSRYEVPDYHNVQELKYLEMVISEALRLYPPGFRFNREVKHDCMVDGVQLPKGVALDIPVGFLHHDPEYWPDPEEFIPERFTAEARATRHPFVYLPFGAGPRSCVGARLAMLEIRLALVHIFRKFTLLACKETKVPLELKSYTTLGPKDGIFVKIAEREIGMSAVTTKERVFPREPPELFPVL